MNQAFRFAQRARTWTWVCVIATAMLGTAVLGILQFRWLGQLSESERETRQTRLSADVLRLSEDFDRELSQTWLAFQLDGDALERRDATEVTARYKLWLAQSAFPRLVRAIWIAEPTGDPQTARRGTGPWRFLRFDTQQGRLVEAIRPAGSRDLDTYDLADSPLDEDTLSILIPVFSATSTAHTPELFVPGTPIRYRPLMRRFVIVELNRQCIVGELLPALLRKHLGNSSPSGEPEYEVVIARNKRPQETVYVSNLRRASSLPRSVDATALLLGIRPYSVAREVKRKSLVTQSPGKRAAGPSLPMSAAGELVEFGTKEYWKLQVTHRAGSLEAFAAQTRRRNLLLSAAILVLLAGSLMLALVAAHRAHSLGRQQVEFVAGISHELRTPVTVMGVAAANLADGIVSEPEEVSRYGKHIQQEVRRLTEMLEHVLSYARIQSVILPPRVRMTPDVLIRGALQRLQPQIEALGFTCTQELDDTLPPVEVDRSSLECVIQNLISNALKYSGEQREIRVTSGKEESRAGMRVWIAVSDLGIGIPPQEHALIFEPFRRGHAAGDRSLPGAGLGLTLVLRIVQAHGGTVEVRSEPEKGSTFTVYLPAARATAGGVDSREMLGM
jgi:signal transduction histidine kinase